MKNEATHQLCRVLVVDDDPICRQFCTHILASSGYLPFEARSAREAMVQLGLLRPHIVLVDMHLPDMTACRFLSEVSLSIPGFMDIARIIGMTGDDSTETLNNLYHAGCSQVLVKPFNGQALVDSMHPASSSEAKPISASFLQVEFRRELDDFLPALDRLITNLDWEQAGHTLHRMAGAAAFSGHHDLGEYCKKLLQILRVPDDQYAIASVYLELLQQASNVQNQSGIPDQ